MQTQRVSRPDPGSHQTIRCFQSKVIRQICAIFLAGMSGHAVSAPAYNLQKPLAELSLEELGSLTISTVARKEESVSRVVASVFVITRQAIRRSGATTLPDVLRLAPNLNVAQRDANRYAISARGFNGGTSNKLQVMIDGRIVYTPLFSGVFWDSQDILVQDIERIEVISGPNAALWGANAVNGLINVITRNSRDTQGGLAAAGAGTQGHYLSARQGGELGDYGHYRVYAKGNHFDDLERADGTSTEDGWRRFQAGFRLDWANSGQSLQWQGDLYEGSLEVSEGIEISGGNLLARWEKYFGSGNQIAVRAYIDHVERDHPGIFGEKLETVFAEMAHTLPQLGRHTVQWGLDYRYSHDRVDNRSGLAFLPAEVYLDWASVFAQDEIHFSDSLWLVANARVEHNDYTGTEVMPSLRLGVKPAQDRLLWAAISRAVRTPSRIDRDFHVNSATLSLDGGPDFQSEFAVVYEVGWRSSSQGPWSWSASTYYADYDDLRSLEPKGGGILQIENGLEGSASGIELQAVYQIDEAWRISGGLSWYDEEISLKSWSRDVNSAEAEGNDPSYQWSITSSHTFGSSSTLDITVRHVDDLPHPEVPAYTVFDVRFGWLLMPNMELAVIGRNLGDSSHPEFDRAAQRAELPHSIMLAAQWNF